MRLQIPLITPAWVLDLCRDLGYDPFEVTEDGVHVVGNRVCITTVDTDDNGTIADEAGTISTTDNWHDLPDGWPR